MVRIICTVIGSALCLIGVVGMLTPIPFGLFVFIIGLLFLIPASDRATRLVRGARRKISPLDRAMSAVTKRMPVPYRRVLTDTYICSEAGFTGKYPDITGRPTKPGVTC